MPLDLAPEVETILEQEAAREGVSVETLIRQTFVQRLSAKMELQQIKVPADDPVLRFLNARIQEAENATPEENPKADTEYEQWQRNMNATRLVNGERLLFPDIANP